MSDEPRPEARRRPRILALDVVRGFALCGILLANVQPIANATGAVVTRPIAQTDAQTDLWLGLLVEQRFFPIFSLLFGVGFALLLESAGERAPRPRLVLLRRLLFLLVLGLLHFFLLWQGDILSTYAVLGLVVLLPASWLPRWTAWVLAPLLIAASFVVGADRTVLIAGLFLLGSALVRYGVIQRIERYRWAPALLAVVLAAAAVPLAVLQIGADGRGPAFPRLLEGAGLLLAAAYVCALLALLGTPLRTALGTVFAPLGRMALTNYLSATLLVLAVARVVGGTPEGWPLATVLLIAGPILALQWLWSTLWLRRFRFGPMEWVWRWATWGRRPLLVTRTSASSDPIG